MILFFMLVNEIYISNFVIYVILIFVYCISVSIVFGIYRIILVNFKFKCLISELDFYN